MFKKFLSTILSLILILAIFNSSTYAINNDEITTDINITENKNKTINYGNYDGKDYISITEINEDASLLTTEVIVRRDLKSVKVEIDLNTGIISSNGSIVGEMGIDDEASNEVVLPYVTDTGFPGGGGQKIFVRQSKLTINSKDWEVVLAIVEAVTQQAVNLAATSLGIEGDKAQIVSLATSSFVKYVVNQAFGSVTTYHKTFYTGQVIKQNRFYYHRYLTEYYQYSSYTGYLGCEWGDSMVRRH